MAKQKEKEELTEFNEIKAKTPNQQRLFKAIYENDVIVCGGPAGTGKTLCAIGAACKLLFQGKIEKILVARTIVPCGDIGHLPGDESEKIAPYLMGHLDYFNKILGKNYKNYIANGKIILKPLETLRGTTFDNTIMILDETQNSDRLQIKMFISRLGQNSKVILLGDESQSDLQSAEGFRFCLNYLENLEGCAIIKLGYDDILRNERIKHILRVFDNHLY